MLKHIKFKRRRGAYYVDFIIGIFVIMIIVALAMSILPVYTQKNMCDKIADSVASCVAFDGIVDINHYSKEVTEIIESSGLDTDKVVVTISTDAETENGKIHIMELFTVTVTYETSLGISYYNVVPITLTGKAVGRSERYWK